MNAAWGGLGLAVGTLTMIPVGHIPAHAPGRRLVDGLGPGRGTPRWACSSPRRACSGGGSRYPRSSRRRCRSVRWPSPRAPSTWTDWPTPPTASGRGGIASAPSRAAHGRRRADGCGRGARRGPRPDRGRGGPAEFSPAAGSSWVPRSWRPASPPLSAACVACRRRGSTLGVVVASTVPGPVGAVVVGATAAALTTAGTLAGLPWWQAPPPSWRSSRSWDGWSAAPCASSVGSTAMSSVP